MPEHYDPNDETFSFPPNGKENPFAFPENYFDTVAARITARIELIRELEEYTILSSVEKDVLFAVPGDYFERNADLLEQAFELQAFPELGKALKDKITEEDYFAALDKKMRSRLELVDELKEFPLLHAIDKQNNFAVDPEYFGTIAGRVKETKFAGANSPSLLDRILGHIFRPRIAIAYGLILIIGSGAAWYYFKGNRTVVSGDCKTLACLEKQEILNEKTMNDFNEEDLYEMVDADALNKQIADSTAVKNNMGDSAAK